MKRIKYLSLTAFLILVMLTACVKNKPVSPEISSDRSSLAKQLIQVAGFDEQLKLLPSLFEDSVLKRITGPAREPEKEDIEKASTIISKAVLPQGMQHIYFTHLQSELTGSELKELISWFDTPSGQRIVKIGIDSLAMDEREKRERFEFNILNLQVPPERLKLIQRYLKARKTVATEIERKYNASLSNARAQSAFSSLSFETMKEKLDKEFQENSETIELKTRHKSFINVLYYYRNLSDEDFLKFILFFESTIGSRFSEVTTKIENIVLEGILNSINIAIYDNTGGQSEEHRFNQYNFTYSTPGTSWTKIAPQKVNAAAKLCLFRANPSVYFLIIPEIIGVDVNYSMDNYLEYSRAKIKSLSSNSNLSETVPFSINGLNGVRYTAAVASGSHKLAYSFWQIINNGLAFQLVAFGEQAEKEFIFSEAEKLFSGFKLIDSSKVFYSADYKPYKNFNSPYFNYSIDLTDQGWADLTGSKKINPNAETGGTKNKSAFFIIPARTDGQKVPNRVILSALLNTLNTKETDPGISVLKPFTEGGVTGYTLNLTRSVDNITYDYAIKIVISNDKAFLLAAWTDDADTDISNIAEKVFSRFKLPVENTALKDNFQAENLPVKFRKSQAEFNNYLGAYFFDDGDYRTALRYAKKSIELDRKSEAGIVGALNCYVKLAQYSAGLELLNNNKEILETSERLISWKAWLLRQIGKNDKAITVYQKLFSKEYQHDDDFTAYLDLLAARKDWSAIDTAFRNYLTKESPLVLYIKQANLLSLRGKHKESIQLLNRLQKGRPLKASISFALAKNHKILKEYKEIVTLADNLIKNRIYLADAYFMKGEAEYNLKWYRKSKTSFEQAVKFSPENTVIKDYIRHISGLLGQGYNSGIKMPVPPVPLPEEFKRSDGTRPDTDLINEYGAYYISRIRGIHYDKNGDQRMTTYKKIKIIDKSGVSAFSTIEINFDPLSEDIYVNKLVVMDRSGKIISKGNQANYFVLDKRSNGMATYDKTLNIPIPNLKPGYTIEIVNTVKFHSRKFVYYSNPLSGSRPIETAGFFVTGDTDRLKYKTERMPETLQLENGFGWVMHYPQVYQWEPFQEKIDEYLPFIRIAENSKTWESLGDDYLSEIENKLTQDDSTEKIAKKLTENAGSDIEKINILLDHIQSDYTYKAIEFGRRGIIPNKAAETIRKKYGDCKDHSVLLFQLLKAVSIPSHLVLVNNIGAVDAGLASLDQFNHMINYIPMKNGGRFVDTTLKHIDMLKYVPANLAKQNAFVLEPGKSRIQKIPDYKDDDNQVRIKTEIQKKDNETLLVNDTVTFTGYAAAFMRDYINTTDKVVYNKWLRKLYSEKVPESAAINFSVENPALRRKSLIFQIRYELECEKKEKSCRFEIPAAWEKYYINIQPVENRKTDFSFYYPFSIDKEVIIQHSDGAKVISDSANKSSEAPFGRWKSSFTNNKKKSTLRFSFHSRADKHDKKRYSEYQSFCDSALKAASPEVRPGQW